MVIEGGAFAWSERRLVDQDFARFRVTRCASGHILECHRWRGPRLEASVPVGQGSSAWLLLILGRDVSSESPKLLCPGKTAWGMGHGSCMGHGNLAWDIKKHFKRR